MVNVFIYLVLSCCILFASCNSQSEFHNSYELELVDSVSVIDSQLRESVITGGIYIQKDNNDSMYMYMLHALSQCILKYNLISNQVDSIFHYQRNDFDDLYRFSISDKDVLLNVKNVLYVSGENKPLRILDSNFLQKIYLKNSHHNPMIIDSNFYIVNYSLQNKESDILGRDSFSTVLIPKDTSLSMQFFGKVLDDSTRNNAYYTGGITSLGKSIIYSGLHMSDTIRTYKYVHGAVELLNANVPIFTDYKVKYKDNKPPKYVGTDMILLNEYLTFFSYNYFANQYQDNNNSYIVKRLPVNDLDSPNVCLLGKIEEDKYMGYAVLPRGFYTSLHVIYNDDIYIVSYGKLYHYKIKRINI